MPNPMSMLRDDHEQVSQLLENLVDTTGRAQKSRTQLLEKIANELEVHTTLEEEIFYPAIRDGLRTVSDKEHVAEGYEEHRAVMRMVLPDAMIRADVSTGDR